MLPTCIGISGVSRYRNDASIEDSFLASLIFSSQELFLPKHKSDGVLAAPFSVQTVPVSGHWSGLCMLRRRICNGKGSRSVKLPELALGLGQTIRNRPQSGRVHAEANMTGKVHLDIFGGIGGTQQAGLPVHDTIGP